MMLSIEEWHQRYLQQALWTKHIRNYLYQKSGIQHATRILDVGCGTGALEAELPGQTNAHLFGADIDFKTLLYARKHTSSTFYTVGNGLDLPFTTGSFDLSLCHFLLLWIDRMLDVVNEMRRVTRPGGSLLALAEPDYGGRIDYPEALSLLGSWQCQALRRQGANPLAGRQLKAIFSDAGLISVEVGILGGQWGAENLEHDFMLEWQVLLSDLEDNQEFQRQSEKLKTIELAARRANQRILYVPVFYAYGVVPG